MRTRTRATVTMIALVLAGLAVAVGASLGLVHLGQPESRVGHFPAVGPISGSQPLSSTPGLSTSVTTQPSATGRTGRDADD